MRVDSLFEISPAKITPEEEMALFDKIPPSHISNTDYIRYFLEDAAVRFYLYVRDSKEPYPCNVEIVDLPAFRKQYAHVTLYNGKSGLFDYDEYNITWLLSFTIPQ